MKSVTLLQPSGCLPLQVLDLDLPKDATVLGVVLDTRLTQGIKQSLRPSLHILLHDCLRNFKIDPYPTGG